MIYWNSGKHMCIKCGRCHWWSWLAKIHLIVCPYTICPGCSVHSKFNQEHMWEGKIWKQDRCPAILYCINEIWLRKANEKR